MRALLLGAVFGIAACSASAPAQRPVKAPVAIAQTNVAPCPLELDGASVEVKDLDQGVALEFTSYSDVAELRRRVRLLGDIQHADGKRYLENVEDGARIVFPADMKSQVVALAQQMDGGACPVTLPTKTDDRVVSR